jgi:PadR family transcriptional regulator, regulatory protein PadR
VAASPQMTTQMISVLAVLASDPARPWYGLEIAGEANLRSGTIYPILARLENVKWLDSTWEDVDPRDVGRPRRRLYELTGAGQAAAEEAVSSHLKRLAKAAPRVRPKAQPA